VVYSDAGWRCAVVESRDVVWNREYFVDEAGCSKILKCEVISWPAFRWSD